MILGLRIIRETLTQQTRCSVYLPGAMITRIVVSFVCEEYVRFVCTSNISDVQAVTLSEMKSKKSKDITLSKLLTEIQSQRWSYDQKPKAYSGIEDELSVFEGTILRGNRIVVPQSLRRQILKLAHIRRIKAL